MKSEYSLYIHIPWCVQKCPYCDFNSHAIKKPIEESGYLACLLRDLDNELIHVSDRQLSSVFIGGGTPSTLSPGFYKELLEAVTAKMVSDSSLEITLEANPGTADADFFYGYRKAGINRLSLGFQSLNDRHLQTLGRIHSASQSLEAFQLAKKAGFDNINIDLMFGLPNQTVEQAMADLENAIALEPQHLSWYQLTLEPNTGFFANPPENIPDLDTIASIQQQGKVLLEKHGYQQYEISAWSQPPHQCRHNLNYWLYGDYIGIGAGAHGKIRLEDGRFKRNSKKRRPDDYLKGDFISKEQFLGEEDRITEYFMNRLRLFRGFTLEEFEKQTDVDQTHVAPRIAAAISKKLMVKQSDNFIPTELGYGFLNDLMELFL